MRALLLFLMIISFALPLHAADVQKENAQLKNVESQLFSETHKKQKLTKKFAKIEKELSAVKSQLLKAGKGMREKEEKLKFIQKRIVDLESRKAKISEELKTERGSIVKLVLILERIRKTPPEVMIARPGSPYRTAQSALLMENIIPSVKRHAQSLKNNLETLNRVSEELGIEKVSLELETKKWKKKSSNLADLAHKKETLSLKLNTDIKARELTIRNISLKAKSLKDLIKSLKDEEHEEIKRQKSANVFRRKPFQKIPMDTQTAQLPLSGIIRTSYKEKDEFGAKSNGIVIEGRSGGLVISPISGKIQFIGSFKRYSNIVIIEHSGGFHSLIAGLGKINAVMGDIVKSGEPIGVMPDSSLIPRPKLYYELRKNGTPVNPSIKFTELG